MIVNEPKPNRLREKRQYRAAKRAASGLNKSKTIQRVELSDGRVLPLTKHQIRSRRSNPEAPIKLSKKQQKKMIKRVMLNDILKSGLLASDLSTEEPMMIAE